MQIKGHKEVQLGSLQLPQLQILTNLENKPSITEEQLAKNQGFDTLSVLLSLHRLNACSR